MCALPGRNMSAAQEIVVIDLQSAQVQENVRILLEQMQTAGDDEARRDLRQLLKPALAQAEALTGMRKALLMQQQAGQLDTAAGTTFSFFAGWQAMGKALQIAKSGGAYGPLFWASCLAQAAATGYGPLFIWRKGDENLYGVLTGLSASFLDKFAEYTLLKDQPPALGLAVVLLSLAGMLIFAHLACCALAFLWWGFCCVSAEVCRFGSSRFRPNLLIATHQLHLLPSFPALGRSSLTVKHHYCTIPNQLSISCALRCFSLLTRSLASTSRRLMLSEVRSEAQAEPQSTHQSWSAQVVSVLAPHLSKQRI